MIDVILAILCILCVIWWWRSKPKDLPPSPGIALPLVGHLHLFKPNLVETIKDWRQRFGDVYMIQMGWKNCVMISGYSRISEAMIKHHESLLQRPFSFLHEGVTEYRGVASLSGEKWKEHRAFVQTTLRKMGVGRNVMADRIAIEIDHLLKAMEEAKGEAQSTRFLVMSATNNVMCDLMFSKRFDYKDETVLYWLGFVVRLFEIMGSSSALNVYPYLRYLPGDYFKYKELRSIVAKMNETLEMWAGREKRSVDVTDENFEDLTQAFLNEIEHKRLKGIKDTTIDFNNFMGTSIALFLGGSETSAGTVQFALLHMIHHPEMQERMYQEIKDVVGIDTAPKMADKPKLKFLSAFVLETQRYSNLVPITVDRLSTTDIQLGGYTIPAGTNFFFNLDSALLDKNVWGDPETFRPGRFLNEAGDLVVPKEFIPFGVGKRMCPGESIANMEIFLFVSALVQRFEFGAEDESNLPSIEPNLGMFRVAKPFKVRAIRRVQ